ncbi:hypothetical protein, partial [Burkholderia cenocepacia]|uniref:hypothetical protein n=1 Tax=Burkholderia cenocepacia TaxID=95486 RepID=UPI001C404491
CQSGVWTIHLPMDFSFFYIPNDGAYHDVGIHQFCSVGGFNNVQDAWIQVMPAPGGIRWAGLNVGAPGTTFQIFCID